MFIKHKNIQHKLDIHKPTPKNSFTYLNLTATCAYWRAPDKFRIGNPRNIKVLWLPTPRFAGALPAARSVLALTNHRLQFARSADWQPLVRYSKVSL